MIRKIDSHQHFWQFDAKAFPWIGPGMAVLAQDRGPGDYAPAMQACGVGGSIAVQARTEVAETDYLLDLAARHPSIVGVVGWVDLAGDALVSQLETWSQQPKLRGFRHILQDEPDVAQVVNNPAFRRGVALLQRQQLVYDVLVFAHQMPLVLDFCRTQDAHWLVLDHLGKPPLKHPEQMPHWVQSLKALAALPHVVCKLSGLVTETAWPYPGGLPGVVQQAIWDCFDQALDAFGPERLLFGSDWPVCELAAPYPTVDLLAHTWASQRLSVTEQAAFWAGNATRYYQLPIS
ncbi:L-fuconolactonase [Rhodoferax ferrireducens]|uniref:L-fuconolactonase n=1 Tax=Rhodoferax ferrireducens TaxID=192843 RepID=A0ABU2C6A6_9BURK|nr:amidohydrolase family protein [Rhodoferax ferrireducens]MDR7376845.1 L-fuconolactonase [Rhodoferax ferrireducens]